MAVRRCPHMTGETVFHSDRGCQYTSEQLSQHLGRYEIIASTGRTGVCWAGAWAEVGGCDPQGTRGSIRWSTTARRKAINDIASWVELVHKSDASSLGARVPDAQRGRTRFGKQ